MKLPQARNEDIVVQNLNGEVLIYDLLTDKAFCLNETCSKIFNACDGSTSFADLKSRYGFSEDLIRLTLENLKTENLLRNYKGGHFAGLTRREMIIRVGIGSIAALPVISILITPTAAHAGSLSCPANNKPNGCSCTQQATCSSRCCSSTPRICVAPGQKSPGIVCVANCECQSGNCSGSPQICQPPPV